MVYSASNAISYEQLGDSFYYLKKQLLWCCAGVAAMVFAMFFNYQNYRRLTWLLLIAAGVLLLLVYVPGIGVRIGGSTRWIKIGGFSFQPVELAKLVLVVYMAQYLSRKSEYIRNFRRGILPSLVILSVFLILIYGQPDFGSVILMGMVAFVMLFTGGARIHQVVMLAAVASLLVCYEIWQEPYRMRRWLTFLDPWRDPEGDGYQIVQSFLALGSGGVLGAGLGAGIQKLHYLPAPHTDFIFSVIGEELGFVGSLIITILFMIIVWRGTKISLSIQDRFGNLLAVGITSLIGFQAAINIGVVTGSLPTKGITLPFISFGGSSMLISLLSMGILLNISRRKGDRVQIDL